LFPKNKMKYMLLKDKRRRILSASYEFRRQ